MTLRLACSASGTPLGPLWGFVSMLACAGAAVIAAPGHGSSEMMRWAMRLARLSAALFALAILFQTLATLIVPPCAR